jgi:predicted XRE-type DNA-binding protein
VVGEAGVNSARKLKMTPGSCNVFADLGFSPEEASLLQIRADLMNELRLVIETRGWTQTAAARELGVSQQRIGDLVRGKGARQGQALPFASREPFGVTRHRRTKPSPCRPAAAERRTRRLGAALMRLLLDSHAFLWWATDSPQLSAAARAAISDPRNEILVSAASAWEISAKQRLGKLSGVPQATVRFNELVLLDGFIHLAVAKSCFLPPVACSRPDSLNGLR